MKGSMGDMLEINSRTRMPKGKKPETKSMEHERSSNGGHVFTHRFHQDGPYMEPETHTYGADEGHEALAHFAKHAGLEDHLPKPDKDSAAGAAT